MCARACVNCVMVCVCVVCVCVVCVCVCVRVCFECVCGGGPDALGWGGHALVGEAHFVPATVGVPVGVDLLYQKQ
jgi:hypothetical protein